MPVSLDSDPCHYSLENRRNLDRGQAPPVYKELSGNAVCFRSPSQLVLLNFSEQGGTQTESTTGKLNWCKFWRIHKQKYSVYHLFSITLSNKLRFSIVRCSSPL